MNLTLEQKEAKMYEMIKENRDVTIGQYWEKIKPSIVGWSEKPVSLPKRYYPTRRPKEPVLQDPSPFKRIPAQYSNRGHYQILEENL